MVRMVVVVFWSAGCLKGFFPRQYLLAACITVTSRKQAVTFSRPLFFHLLIQGNVMGQYLGWNYIYFFNISQKCPHEHLLLKQCVLHFMTMLMFTVVSCSPSSPLWICIFWIWEIVFIFLFMKLQAMESTSPFWLSAPPFRVCLCFLSPSLSLHGGWVASVATAGALAACSSFS